jgi:hypothetical protein
MTRATPPYAAEELLINENKFDAWFGDNVSEQTRSNNVGRRVRELAITYLPDRLLSHHCDDMGSGATHAESRVYEYFQDNYGVAELEAMDLWSRLDAKIASFGDCEHIP